MRKLPFNSAVPPPPSQAEIEEFCTAAKHGELNRVAQIFRRFGSQILEKRDMRKDTALTWAAYSNHLQVMQFLLDCGAKIDGPGMEDKPPITWAAQGNRKEAVQFLLERGASPEAPDAHGKPARDYAHDEKIRDLLEDWANKKKAAERERKRAEAENRQKAADAAYEDRRRQLNKKQKLPKL